MEIIVGVVILQNNKILMVKEAKEECYGKLAIPAGHLENNETIIEGAKRELLEETGYEADIVKAFPIMSFTGKRQVIMFHFLAENAHAISKYNTEEIISTGWIDIDEIEKMNSSKFRKYEVLQTLLTAIKENKYYNIDMIKNFEY